MERRAKATTMLKVIELSGNSPVRLALDFSRRRKLLVQKGNQQTPQKETR
jgi:hypothetical protein